MISDQIDFAAALLDPNTPAPINLLSPDGSPAGARFDVYRNNVTTSLIEAMRTGFPVIEKLIGAANFQTLALMFVRAHPPTSPVLMFYGQGFDTFIAGFEPLKNLPYLPDVARLELIRRDSYHAPDAATFGPDDMAALGEDGFMAGRLQFAPATRVVASAFPIYDIWLRNSGADDHAIGRTAQHVLLTRPAFDVLCFPMSPDVAGFVTALNTKPVADAIGDALQINREFPLADALGLILTSGPACAHNPEPS